ncbi:MAG: B12-binding domain-containing radical SAM protein [Endomicrobiales bacterium]|nr:B12-binding domain-containing radical SAM protein [Endomicrobiales bacterium]
MPNLGVGYVGASLKSDAHRVRIFDSAFYDDYIPVLRDVLKEFEPEVVGITGFTFQHSSMIKMAELVNALSPDTLIILGGPHASVLAKTILAKYKFVDFVIVGEGEESFPGLLKALYTGSALESLPGLVYRNEGGIRANNSYFISDLDNLKKPWDVLNPLDYQKGRIHGFIAKEQPVTQVISSRGCPYECTFCAGRAVLGNKMYLRDPKKFVDEIEYLKDEFGIKEVQIVDDNFTFYRDHAVNVCNEMINRKLDISWSLPNGVRADKLDKELLGLMKKAGCYSIGIGIEFGSPRMLKMVHKSLDLEKAKETVMLCNKLGFITTGFFLIGYPEETLEDIKMTADFISSLPFDRIRVSIPFPYPGSELFKYYLERNYHNAENIDWDHFHSIDNICILENLNKNFVEKFCRNIYFKFYLNPFNTLRFLSKFRTWIQFKSVWQGFKIFLQTMEGTH